MTARALLFLVGLALSSWASLPEPNPAQPPSPRSAPSRREQHKTTTPCRSLLAFDEEGELDEGEAEADRLLDLIERHGLASPEGSAFAWPEGLEPTLGPDGFPIAFDRVRERCPNVFGDEVRTDCTEFPCFVTWVEQGSLDTADIDKSRSCPQLQQTFGVRGRVSPSLVAEQRNVRLMTMDFWPASMDVQMKAWRGNLIRRGAHRLAPHRTALIETEFAEACAARESKSACLAMAWSAHLAGDRRGRIDYKRIACDLGDVGACDFIAELRPRERHWE